MMYVKFILHICSDFCPRTVLSDFSHIIKITGSLCDRYRLDLKYIVLKMVVIFVNRYEKLN